MAILITIIVVFTIYLTAGKIKCKITKKHIWDTTPLWRTCKSCNKHETYIIRLGEYK
jgi:hypothetical protein